MKRLFCSVLAAGFVLAVAAGPYSAADEHSADGLGNFRFGEDAHGVAMFDFDVTSDPQPAGELLCAGEDHGYPGIIIRVQEITMVRFGFRTLTFKGNGFFHDNPVSVTVKAYDGSGTSKPDHFWIKAVPGVQSHEGGPGFEAEGDVTTGDIRIGVQN